MPVQPAGEFRRTDAERSDQEVAWHRADQAFFASGACHILAWACRDTYVDRPIDITAVRFEGEQHAMHTYATWGSWAFDHSGWNPESELLAANAAFEGALLERIDITVGLAEFCKLHLHRMPHQFWRDPGPRARDYVIRHRHPWG